MDLRIIYIEEKDLNENLVKQLVQIKFEDVRVLFFVELKEVDSNLVPMISDLPLIRIEKAERRIRKWLEEHVAHISNYEVLVFHGPPSRTNPKFKLSVNKNAKLNVLVHPEHESRIAPYLYHHAGAHQIKYFSLGDFSM